ncbi:MAG: conjugal transfer protein TrbF [Acidobacteriia bacterium]|nr:conjugal transfer protein TrbF [Terriglobia bacterium]
MERTAENLYIAARHEWDERYGGLMTRATNWRRVALLGGATAFLAVGGLLWFAAHSRVVPFVVLVDQLARPVAAGVADETTANDDRLKRAALFGWLENLRMVTTDGVAQRKAIDRVYAQIANASPAQTFVSEFYRANQPFTLAQTETIAVEVRSVLATSDRTYEVEWDETTRDLYGAIKSRERWKGSFTIALNPPKDESIIRINPLGLYIVNASWTKVL